MIEFAAYPMLLSLAAAAIPFLLMRARVRNAKQIDWPENRFLKEALQFQRRRASLTQLLLLILRTLALVFLSFAVADPIFRNGSDRLDSSLPKPKLYVFAIDNSPSMGLLTQDETQLSRARNVVSESLANANGYDLVAICSANYVTSIHYVGNVQNRADWSRRLLEIDSANTSVDLTVLGTTIQRAIEDIKKQYSSVVEVTAVVVSDFSLHEWSQSGLEQLSQTLTQGNTTKVHWHAVDLGSSKVRNLTLTDLKISQTDSRLQTRSGDVENVTATIENTGDTDLSQASLQWSVNDQLREPIKFSLPSGESVDIALTIQKPRAGNLHVSAELSSDDLVADNVRYCIVPENGESSATVIAKNRATAGPLRIALETLGVEADYASTLPGRTVSGQAMHLVDPETLGDADLHAIRQIASQGGHVYIWIGESLSPTVWQNLSSTETNLELLPAARIEEAVWRPDSLAGLVFQAMERDRPLTSGLAIPVTKYWRFMDLDTDWKPRIVLSNGDVFAAGRDFASGSVHWISMAPTLAGDGGGKKGEGWNAMAVWPSFVPLIDQMRQLPSFSQQLDFRFGETPRIDAVAAGLLKIVFPNGETKTFENTNANGSSYSVETTQVGGYRWEQMAASGASLNRGEFLVNYDAREFELEYLNLPKAASLQEVADSPQLLGSQAQQEVKPFLYRWLLVTALVLLVAELIFSTWWLARRFSQHQDMARG